MNHTDDFEELIRQRFDDFEMNAVPESHWDNISRRLPQKPFMAKRIRVAVSTVLIVALFSLILITKQEHIKERPGVNVSYSKEKFSLNNNFETLPIANKAGSLPTNILDQQPSHKPHHFINQPSPKRVLAYIPEKVIENVITDIVISQRDPLAMGDIQLIKSAIHLHPASSSQMLFIISSIATHIDDPISPKGNTHRLTGFLHINPFYCSYAYSPNLNDDIIVNQISTSSTFSVQRIGLKTEAGITWPVSERFKVFSGIGFAFVPKNVLYASNEMMTDTVTVILTETNTYRLIPVYDSHNIHESEVFNLEYLLLGINFNTHIGSTMYYTSVNGEFNLMKGKYTHNMSTGFSFGIEKEMSRNISYTFGPVLNYYFNETPYSSTLLHAKPYSLGLRLGVAFGRSNTK